MPLVYQARSVGSMQLPVGHMQLPVGAAAPGQPVFRSGASFLTSRPTPTYAPMPSALGGSGGAVGGYGGVVSGHGGAVSQQRVDSSQATLALPPGANTWMQMEVDLFKMSGGAYNPAEMAKKRRVKANLSHGTGAHLEVPGRVSIVSPTMATRQLYHESLWRCYNETTWLDKELVVYETYEQSPSSFFREKAKTDSRIIFVTLRRAAGTDFTVGLKRNMTLHLASGEFIVNFDDDDLYAPCYVERIVGEMQKKGLMGVTLSAWYNYYVGQGRCTFSDPSCWGEWVNDPTELDNILYGYGFSYSHRRAPALTYPYPNKGFAEDAPFFLNLRRLYGDAKVILWKDTEGMCVHIMHHANTAQVLGTMNCSAADIAGLAVTDCKPFQQMIDNDFFRFSPWRPPVRPPALSMAGSVQIHADDDDDVDFSSIRLDARLRASTLVGGSLGEAAGFGGSSPVELGMAGGSVTVEAEPLAARPRADTFRNLG